MSTTPSTTSIEFSRSTGGVRGILQAVFLDRLETDIGALRERFDLVAATSTGALVGLGIAAGLPARDLVELYRVHLPAVFRAKPAALIRRGGRYRTEPLREVLAQHFGELRLGELEVDVLICASALNRFQGRIFTRADTDVLVVDAALASAAAPTFFEPVVPEGSERGYLDGGLWANDPLLVAIAYASRTLGVPTDAVEALSIGTGKVPRGCTPDEAAAMRILSLDTVRFLLQISGSLQEWSSQHLLERLTSSRVRRINPELVEWVELDDVGGALRELPGLAETEYEQHGPALVAWLRGARRAAAPARPPLPTSLETGIRAAGLSQFMPARRYYREFRGGRDSISSYVASATRTLTMVSINLATGGELEQIERVFGELVERPDPVRVRISLLDYEDPALMHAVSTMLDMPTERMRKRIHDTMATLKLFRRSLEQQPRGCLELFVHRTIPSASAILIDANTDRGRIQLETKPYKAPATASWAFEVQAGSEFYETLRAAYHDLISDGDEVLD